MNYPNIIDSIHNKKIAPIYLLHGEEPYFINEISKLLEKVVVKNENKSFDQKILYGKEINVDDLICDAKSFPMIDDYQLIIVKSAQDLKKIEKLEDYINSYQTKTVLVICYYGSKVRKNAKWFKALNKSCFIIFESNKLYSNQIPNWILNFLKLWLNAAPAAADTRSSKMEYILHFLILILILILIFFTEYTLIQLIKIL